MFATLMVDADLIQMGLWDAYYGHPRKIHPNTSTQQPYDDAYLNEMERHS